ncbi:MAG: rhamnulokinase family protein [bacterium]|nr:rhamnulokinase family protein [bacterium]
MTTKKKHVIAVDLGAESGRVMRVDLDGARLSTHEIHRFPNVPVMANGTLHWDVLRLWKDITDGLRAARADSANPPASIGVDTWGVDFALLDRDGRLLANPVHYRDRRTEGMMDWVFQRMPRREVFQRTGIQFMPLNGLYQFASLVRDNSPLLSVADGFLTIADLFNYWLSGARTCEFTHVTTQQMYNPVANDWDRELLSCVELPTRIFPEIVQPGTRIGAYEGVPVILPGCHDTASAVVAVPTSTKNYAYLSSGTWSLLGLELTEPIINDAAYEANLTNEGGVYGTFRLLKNIAGMWLVQQCRAAWARQGTSYDYAYIKQLAAEAEPFRSFIDPDAPDFFAPDDMPAAIRDYCARTGQPVPETPGQIARAAYEGLAFKYRYVLEKLIDVSGQPVETLHIIGGGSQNDLLCQMTADAIGRRVVAGPAEGTAIGNGIVQLISLGELADLRQARQALAASVALVVYEPQSTAAWDAEFGRFQKLIV